MPTDLQFLFVVTLAINLLSIYCSVRGIVMLRELRFRKRRAFMASFNQRLVRL